MFGRLVVQVATSGRAETGDLRALRTQCSAGLEQIWPASCGFSSSLPGAAMPSETTSCPIRSPKGSHTEEDRPVMSGNQVLGVPP